MTVKLSGPRIVLQTLRYGVRYGSRYVALRHCLWATCHISDVDGNNPAMIETVAAMIEVKNLSKILQNLICHISVGMRLYSGGLCFFLVKPEIDFDLLVNWTKFSSGFDMGLLSPITLQVPMMTPLVPYYSCLARATISGIHCKTRVLWRSTEFAVSCEKE